MAESWGKTYGASSSTVCLDSATILAVRDSGVRERNIFNVIVALSSHRSDTQTVASGTSHTSNGDVDSAGNSHAIILVRYCCIRKNDVVARREIEAIRVM